MVEVGYDVPVGGGKVGEEDVADGEGTVGCAAGGADDDLERVGNNIGAGRFRHKVDTDDAGVCNSSVGRCNDWIATSSSGPNSGFRWQGKIYF